MAMPQVEIDWLNTSDVRPYVFMRVENRMEKPGTFLSCDWFQQSPIMKDPLLMEEVGFADQILNLESKAFQKSAMPMPRWVFYDCAVMPGLVCGFARRTSTLSATFVKSVGVDINLEWTPISLFIIIPTAREGEWVAHNLCTSNSLVEEADQHYALGFLTKAFGLWYANVKILCGMTQWQSPAIRLHSHYGPFEVLTAYTPVHSYAQTLTYRCALDFAYWPGFFTKSGPKAGQAYKYSGFDVDPKNIESLKSFQRQIQDKKGPFYLNPHEIRTQALDASLRVYHLDNVGKSRVV